MWPRIDATPNTSAVAAPPARMSTSGKKNDAASSAPPIDAVTFVRLRGPSRT